VRGALEPLPGVKRVAVVAGNRDFSVLYDPRQVDVPRMLAALERAKEPATAR
jgi:hypothetical protein